MKTNNQKNSGMLAAFLVLLGTVAVISLAGWLFIKPSAEMLQGQAEATEIRVSGKVPGRIEKLLVNEGEPVEKGDTLVLISSPELRARMLQAESAEDAAAAQNRKAIKGIRKEQIDGAYELWQKAEVGVSLAEKTFARVQNMYNDGVIPAQKRDEAEAALQAARATAKAARSQYDMAVNGAEKEDKDAAAALVNRAKGAVNEVESYLSETVLLSPISGEVSDIFPETGELVGSGSPVMSIVDLNDIHVIFNIREDMLSGITMGKEFNAKVPALGGKTVRLKVSYIKAMAGYATFKATKSNDSFDVKTFEVRAKPVNRNEGIRPGMSLMADFSDLH